MTGVVCAGEGPIHVDEFPFVFCSLRFAFSFRMVGPLFSRRKKQQGIQLNKRSEVKKKEDREMDLPSSMQRLQLIGQAVAYVVHVNARTTIKQPAGDGIAVLILKHRGSEPVFKVDNVMIMVRRSTLASRATTVPLPAGPPHLPTATKEKQVLGWARPKVSSLKWLPLDAIHSGQPEISCRWAQ